MGQGVLGTTLAFEQYQRERVQLALDFKKIFSDASATS